MGYMDAITSLPGISALGGGGAAAAFNPLVAVGSLGAEGASAWYSNRMAEKRQHEAFDQQLMMMQNRYQMQTKDMMAAGLNPMLAVNQGAPSPTTPSAAQVTKPDLLAAVSNAQLASAQAAKIRQETENLKLESVNIQNTAAQFPTIMQKLGAEIDDLEQRVKTGKATEAELRSLKVLNDVRAKLGEQEYNILRPEEIASGTKAAATSAAIEKALGPLLNMLGTGARSFRDIKSRR